MKMRKEDFFYELGRDDAIRGFSADSKGMGKWERWYYRIGFREIKEIGFRDA